MKRRFYLKLLATLGLALPLNTAFAKEDKPIIHTVMFKLKHAEGSKEEKNFLEKSVELSKIKGVNNFSLRKQISKKNPYSYQLYMQFNTQADYDFYNNHPEHQAYVKNLWLKEVADFQEADFILAD